MRAMQYIHQSTITWIDGWIALSSERSLESMVGCLDGWLAGWMNGWMDGWYGHTRTLTRSSDEKNKRPEHVSLNMECMRAIRMDIDTDIDMAGWLAGWLD